MKLGTPRVALLPLLVALGVACGGGDDGAGGSGGGERDGAAPPADAGPSPNPAFVPAPTGACPDLVEGKVRFSPAGIPERDVQLWVGPEAETLDGPVVFYWHGWTSSPAEANVGLGPIIERVKALGGLVAAPFSDPGAGTFPWYHIGKANPPDDDMMVADEVLACAQQRFGVDLTRIHSAGMSAGGLQTVAMSYRRSGYLASVVAYSGGRQGKSPYQDPENKFAALAFYGGDDDKVIIDFKPLTLDYQADLKANGHFVAVCNHGRGHTIPTDAVESVWQFLQDHTFGRVPSPYATGLPTGFPSYCAL